MEYCERDLKTVISDGTLFGNEGEVWRLFRQVVEALEYTHRSKIIHREWVPLCPILLILFCSVCLLIILLC